MFGTVVSLKQVRTMRRLLYMEMISTKVKQHVLDPDMTFMADLALNSKNRKANTAVRV